MKSKKTKPQLRVEIARDVIKHIKAEKIKAVSCFAYFQPHIKGEYKGKQLKEILPKIKNCTVCALGGMFYSYIERHNNFTLDGRYGLGSVNAHPDKMREAMTMFTKNQLLLIECAFESTDSESMCRLSGISGDVISKAISFKIRNSKDKLDYMSAKENLTLIMKNIIKNKGTFKP